MEQVTYDENIPMLDLGDDVMVGPKKDVQAEALWHGIPIEGFTSSGEEMIRAAISRVPPELLTNVHCIKAAPELQPKHGRYDPDTHTVNINPLIFNLRQRFGEGQGWIYHTELCTVHEIGHSIYYFFPEKAKDQWREISDWMVGTQAGQDPPYKETRPGWPKDTSKWTHKKGVKFTRKYAQKNDDEDFADSFAFFILNKPHQMEPAKREFIEKLIKERVKTYPQASIEGPIQAGGPGSGCNPEVAEPRCGRPSTGSTSSNTGNRLITVDEMNRVQRAIRGNDRYRQLMARLADGEWHPLESPAFTKPSPRTGFYTGMRNAIRPLGFNVVTRGGQARLERAPVQPTPAAPTPPVNQKLPTTMEIIDRGRSGQLSQDQVREKLQRQSESVVNQLGPQKSAPPVPSTAPTQETIDQFREYADPISTGTREAARVLSDGAAHTEADILTQVRSALPAGLSISPDLLSRRLTRLQEGGNASGNWNLVATENGWQLQRGTSQRPATPASAPSTPAPAPVNTNPDFRKPMGSMADPDRTETPTSLRVKGITIDQQDLDKFYDKFRMTPADLKNSLYKGLPDDIMSNARMSINRSGDIFQMTTRAAGLEQDRSFDFSGMTVSHNLQTLSDQYQGHDWGKVIMNNQLDLYDHLGMKKAVVHAGLSNGGYAWARFGFVPSRDSWEYLKGYLGRRIPSDLSADSKAQVELVLGMTDPRAIWVLAGLKDNNGKSIGSKLLRGQGWTGTLDLNNRENYAVARAYSASRSKRS